MKNLLDVHTHTISSGHAYSTLQENISVAAQKQLTYYGMSDHGPIMYGAPHSYHFSNLRVIPSMIDGVYVLKGAEINILNRHGDVDLEEIDLASLDYTIASIHRVCFDGSTKEEATEGVIQAMHNKYVRIIGHPDDSRFPLDYEAVVQAAKQTNTLLEVNNSSLLPTSFREGANENYLTMLELCMKYEVPVICNSDAHISSAVGNCEDALALLDSLEFPKHLIVNYNQDLINKFLLEKK